MLTVFDDDSTPVGVILAVGVGVKVVVCVIVAVRDFDTLDSADASGGGGGIGDDDGVIDDVSVLEQVPEPVIVSVGDNESDDVGEGVGDVDQVTLAEPPSEKVNVSEAVTVIEKLNVVDPLLLPDDVCIGVCELYAVLETVGLEDSVGVEEKPIVIDAEPESDPDIEALAPTFTEAVGASERDCERLGVELSVTADEREGGAGHALTATGAFGILNEQFTRRMRLPTSVN